MSRTLLTYVEKGGQVLGWKPQGQNQDVLFCSGLADLHGPAPIRGGIPVCWPWFGPKEGKGQHGFARTRQWTLLSSEVTEEMHQCSMVLQTGESDFSYKAQLEIHIIAGLNLHIQLITLNKDSKPMPFTQALHTYFQVGDCTKVAIEGLDGKSFIDKTRNGELRFQEGSVTIGEETDRVYKDASLAVLKDKSWGREIKIEAKGANAMVVWNPWAEKCRLIKDLRPDDYLNFVCIEPASTPEEIIVEPGASHTLDMLISVNTI